MPRKPQIPSDLTVHEHCSCVEGLEADIRLLKRELAAARGKPEPVVARSKGDGWMSNLSPQDAAYMQRKLGTKEKK
jgi:hypothetical protein